METYGQIYDEGSKLSSLKKLANSIRRETQSDVYKFNISFPLIEQQIFVDNKRLISDIRESGAMSAVTQAKCYRTRWDMHTAYESFWNLGQVAIEIAKMNPLAGRSKPDGTPDPIPYGITESWGLIYNKGNFTSTHSHWPSTWGFVYTVQACENCSPLIFDQSDLMGQPVEIFPKTGQMLLFPAWLNHSVPEQQCEHERIKIAGNLDTAWDFKNRTFYREL